MTKEREYNAANLQPDEVEQFIADGFPRDEPDEAGPVVNRLKPTSEREAAKLYADRVRFVPWLELRHALGRTRDRRRWLQFLCAVTSYTPFSSQIRAHLADSGDPNIRTNKLLIAGIRYGKSVWAAAEGAMLDTFNPGVDHCVIAPTYDQVRDVLLPKWTHLMTKMAASGYPLLRRMNWSIMRADLHCGARVFFRSSDKYHNLRGFEFGSVRFDECDFARRPMDALDMLMGRLSAPAAYLRELCATTTPHEYAGSVTQHWQNQRERAEKMEPEERMAMLRSWWFGRARTLDNPTLPPDFLAGLASYGVPQWFREIEGYPSIHHGAKVFDTYGERHIYRVKPAFDRRLAYHLAADWAQHRPSYLWIQPLGNGYAVIFDEYHPENVPPERQLDEVDKRCRALGGPPEAAAVDRNDPEQIAAFKRRFRSTRVLECVERDIQLRRASVQALQRLMDPIDGSPKLLVAEHLTVPSANNRGIHRVFSEIMWEWDRLHNCYGDVADKDGLLDHGFDAAAYWAKLVGVEAVKAAVQRPIARSGGGTDSLLRGGNIPGLR